MVGFKHYKSLKDELKVLIGINELHGKLDKMPKDVVQENQLWLTNAQEWHNTLTNGTL